MYSNWQKIEENLKSKKDSKVKLEASNKLDKVPTVAAEIKEVKEKFGLNKFRIFFNNFLFHF